MMFGKNFSFFRKKKQNKEGSLSFVRLFREVYGRLPKKRKKQFWILFAVMAFVSLSETVATGSIALFASTVSAPLEILNSKYLIGARQIFQMDFLSTTRDLIIYMSFLVLFLVTFKNGFQIFLNYWITRFSYMLDEHFGGILFNGFLNIPYEWHLSRNSADIILSLQWRTYLGSSFILPAFTILNNLLVVLFLLATLFTVQPLISVMLLVVFGSTALVIQMKMYRLQEHTADRCREFDREINREATKAIHGIKDVKITGCFWPFLQHFKKNAYNLARTKGLQVFYRTSPFSLLETLGFVMLTGCTYIMFLFDSPTSVLTGTLALIAVAAWRILPAINKILASFSSIVSILPYTKDEIGYLKEIEGAIDDNASLTVDRSLEKFNFSKDIRLENVSFAYKNRSNYVISNINIQINKGQTLGVIGHSGAGKSTLVDIIIGLLPQNKGKIIIDGRELDMVSQRAWLTVVGYVSQTPYIIDGSLLENVAFGLAAVDIDRGLVWECCKLASMEDFLTELPQGIDSHIGERGVRLSGGQRQRVAIARALYLKPEIIIFDEATSSLDNKNEKAIQETIYGLKGKLTLIIVAHRLSTVKDCDFLVWLEKGKIKMLGSAEEILAKYEKR